MIVAQTENGYNHQLHRIFDQIVIYDPFLIITSANSDASDYVDYARIIIEKYKGKTKPSIEVLSNGLYEIFVAPYPLGYEDPLEQIPSMAAAILPLL